MFDFPGWGRGRPWKLPCGCPTRHFSYLSLKETYSLCPTCFWSQLRASLCLTLS